MEQTVEEERGQVEQCRQAVSEMASRLAGDAGPVPLPVAFTLAPQAVSAIMCFFAADLRACQRLGDIGPLLGCQPQWPGESFSPGG